MLKWVVCGRRTNGNEKDTCSHQTLNRSFCFHGLETISFGHVDNNKKCTHERNDNNDHDEHNELNEQDEHVEQHEEDDDQDEHDKTVPKRDEQESNNDRAMRTIRTTR